MNAAFHRAAPDRDELIERIYAAVEDSSAWTAFLEAFRIALSLQMAAFWMAPADSQGMGFSVSVGLTPDLLEAIRDPAYRDPWMSRLDLNRVPVGTILPSQKICPDEILIEDPWYQRLCVPNDLHYGGGVMLALSSSLTAGMSCNRRRAAGPLTEREIALWHSLVPHLTRAATLINSQWQIRRERDALIHYFDDLGQCVLLTRPDGLILASNTHAKALLERDKRVAVRDGRLELSTAEPQRRLSNAVGATGKTSHAVAVHIVVPHGANPPLLVSVVALGAPAAAPALQVNAPTSLVTIRETGALTQFDPAPLRQLFGFTAAEARLACRLAAGESLTLASQKLEVSRNTARTHLQRALMKADLHRQAELVSLVLRFCGGTRPRAKVMQTDDDAGTISA